MQTWPIMPATCRTVHEISYYDNDNCTSAHLECNVPAMLPASSLFRTLLQIVNILANDGTCAAHGRCACRIGMVKTAPRALLPGGASLSRTGYFSSKERPPPRSVMMSSMLTSDSLSEDPVSLYDSESSSLLVLHSSSASAKPA